MNPIEKVRLGETDLFVTRMGMGGAALGGLYKEVSDASAAAAVEAAVSLGINLFDTAPLYGHGLSEQRLGRSLLGRARDSFILSTKVGRMLVPVKAGTVDSPFFERPAPFQPVFDFSYDGALRSFEESLKRLNLGRVDILYIHDPDDHYEKALRGAYRALRQLRNEGTVRAIGVGMNQAEMLERWAREADFDCFLVAGRYTLIDHAALRELLPLSVEKKIGVVIGGPYNSGILAGSAVSGAKFNYENAPAGIVEKVRRIEQLCSRYSISLKAAALQFPLAHPAVASVIPGSRSRAEAEENFRLLSVPISPDFWSELKAERLIPSDAPVPGSDFASDASGSPG